MTCRHMKGDPDCSSTTGSWKNTYTVPATPEAERYEVVDVRHCTHPAIGLNRLVLKVKYPNCSSCAFEGTKVLVYENTTPLDALKWKRIDPHFRVNTSRRSPTDAPSPMARFPASDDGWKQAIWFAENFQ